MRKIQKKTKSQDEPNVSALILTKNRPELFGLCLKSLLNQTHKPDEIVVVDGSTRPLGRYAIEELAPATLIRYIRDNGASISHARNIAVMSARGNILVFLDDDCKASDTYVERAVSHFKLSPLSVAVMGRLVNNLPHNVFSTTQYGYYERWLLSNFPELSSVQLLPNGMVLDCEALAIKKDFIQKFLFDTDTMGSKRNEDTEMGTRLFAANRNIYFDPYMIARVSYRQTLLTLLKTAHANGYADRFIKATKHIDVRKTPRSIPLFPWAWNKTLYYIRKKRAAFGIKLLCLLVMYPLASRLGRAHCFIDIMLRVRLKKYRSLQ